MSFIILFILLFIIIIINELDINGETNMTFLG